jgi:enoyl-CoA hydratase/carnithine racemase
VPQMLGYHRAAEALLLGEPFMAEAALEVGLVNRVVPPTEANGIAQSIARKLAAKPLSSLVETKRLMKKGQKELVIQQMADEESTPLVPRAWAWHLFTCVSEPPCMR